MSNGVLASTTGNVYGIYDMNGGGWEHVAAFWDNSNSYISTSGNSAKVNYFDTATNNLNSTYSKYWEAYKVSKEEKDNESKLNKSDIQNIKK